MIHPIWKDYYVDFGAVASVVYDVRLADGTTIIYSGKAQRRPDAETCRVKINDICADYMESLRMQEVDKVEGFISETIAVTFKIFNSIGSLVEEVTFVNDWSYDYDKEDDGVLSAPINGLFDVRMPLLYSISKAQTIEVDAQDTHADFSIDFSADFNIGYDRKWMVDAASSGTLILKNIFDQHGDVKVGNITYHGERTCATHALYYINAYGGWDFLLMQGRSVESDSYSRKTMKKEYDNNSVQNRGTSNYLNEVEKTFTLRTGLLFGDQGQRMHHLIGSTEVYMYDLEKGDMIPVVLTTNECRYKTYGTEGNKLMSYEIGVRVAHNRIRR